MTYCSSFSECLVDRATGYCRASIRKYFFNASTGHCQEFIYGGCGGNLNRFPDFESCNRDCTCKAAPEAGPCYGHIRRWFYSAKDSVCRPFVFGGCGGNGNSYASWDECSNACGYPESNNNWWKWWKGGGQLGSGNGGPPAAANKSTRGYTQTDFIKDYMMLGMLGELELEGMGDMMNLYTKLQAMGGLSTMQSGAHSRGRGANMLSSRGRGNSLLSEYGGGSWAGEAAGATEQSGFEGLFGMGERPEQNGEGNFFDWLASSSNLGSQWNSNSGWSGGVNGARGQGLRGQAGMQGMGVNQRVDNGAMVSTASNTGSGSFTPLGHIGRQVNTFTPLGASGSVSLSDIKGNSLSNLAKEINGMSSSWRKGNFGEADFNLGSRGSSSSANLGWAPNGAFDITAFVKSLASGSIKPKDLVFMAKLLGAMDKTGKIDINIMLSQLAKSLANIGAASGHQLKGVAKTFGAMNNNGNIDMNKFLQGVAGSMGGLVSQLSRVWETNREWPVNKIPSANFVKFIRHLASGSLSPADMTHMAKNLGVVDQRGTVDIKAMVQSLMRALSNPGIKADLQGTASRLGAVDRHGNINVRAFLNKMAKSIGTSGTEMGKSNMEIMSFLTRLGTGQLSPKHIRDMATKIKAVDNNGNINLNMLGKWIAGTASNPARTADLKGVANHLGALDTHGQVNVNLLLRGLSRALKGAVDGVGGASGNVGGALGGMKGVSGGSGGTQVSKHSSSSSGYNWR